MEGRAGELNHLPSSVSLPHCVFPLDVLHSGLILELNWAGGKLLKAMDPSSAGKGCGLHAEDSRFNPGHIHYKKDKVRSYGKGSFRPWIAAATQTSLPGIVGQQLPSAPASMAKGQE